MLEDDEKFDDFDDEDPDFSLTEVELWFDDNIEYFLRTPTPLSELPTEITLETELFYYNVYCPAKKQIKPAVLNLIHKQYPLTANEMRPRFLEEIDKIATEAGHHLLMRFAAILCDQKDGINVREFYTDFEQWEKEYARPEDPPQPDYSFADSWENKPDLTEQFIKEIADEVHVEELEAYHYHQGRRKEYFDLLQSIIIELYPAFLDFDLENWIMYARALHEDYFEYTENCDHIETMLEYKFDEADFDLGYLEFRDKLMERM